MATAQGIKVEVVREEDGVQLRLNAEEARVLRFILGRIGGDPRKSPRRVTDVITEALSDAGVPWNSDDYEVLTGHRAIYFENVEE